MRHLLVGRLATTSQSQNKPSQSFTAGPYEKKKIYTAGNAFIMHIALNLCKSRTLLFSDVIGASEEKFDRNKHDVLRKMKIMRRFVVGSRKKRIYFDCRTVGTARNPFVHSDSEPLPPPQCNCTNLICLLSGCRRFNYLWEREYECCKLEILGNYGFWRKKKVIPFI